MMLAGPLKCRKSYWRSVGRIVQSQRVKHTLSPQIVFLPHVLSVKAAFRVNLHTVDFLIVCQKRVFGSKFVGLGIWNLNKFALNL